MLSEIPINLEKIQKEEIDKEILILLDIAREEKTHVGEFQTLLLELDKEQEKELEEGSEEVRELLKH
jgi:rubrerythrin